MSTTNKNIDIIINSCNNIDISKTRIMSMFKGDTSSFNLQINVGTYLEPSIYTLEDWDTLNFYILHPNSDLASSVIYKTYTKDNLNEDSSITIKLDSYDTEYLNEGQYYYTIKLVKANGDIITIQKRTKFIIMN